MPGNPMAPGLAESRSVPLTARLRVRPPERRQFHNGEPRDGRGLKFSLERYRGAASKVSRTRSLRWKARIWACPNPAQAAVARLPHFYSTAPPAGFARNTWRGWATRASRSTDRRRPPTELSRYARRELVSKPTTSTGASPSVKRLVFKVIPDESTRLAALSVVRWTSSIDPSAPPRSSADAGAHAEADRDPGVDSGSRSSTSGTRSHRGMTGRAPGRQPAIDRQAINRPRPWVADHVEPHPEHV